MDTFEKKYNEAMLRADEAVQKGCLDKDMFDIIFPPEESEDERIRKALVWHLKADVDFVSNGVTKAECLAYLDKQKAQKQEWNEEDKRILKGIIGLVDHNQHYNVSNKEMLDWLKSLRPSWKPSEEQMVKEALEGEVMTNGFYPYEPRIVAPYPNCPYDFGDKVRIIIVKDDL